MNIQRIRSAVFASAAALTAWVRVARVLAFGGMLLLPAASLHALPVLEQGKFFAPSSLFTASDWSYTGTLPSSIDAGFKAKNIDDDFFGDSGTQYSTGSRRVTTTTGAAPSYALTFRGEFEPQDSEAWDTSLLAQSNGTLQDDIDKVEFPNPGGATTNEHPIPPDWRGLQGYANPTGSYAKFDRTFALSRNYLLPGEGGCPITVSPGGPNTGHCAFTEAYFKGGANLQASLQGNASIENIFPGTQNVSIDAKANRITTFKVNEAPIFSGDVNGSQANFLLEEEKVNAVDFSFKGDFKTLTFTVGANVQWDGSGDTSSFDASYVKRVEMPEYENVGLANEYKVEVRDDPQLTAGITGGNFDRASVLALAGLSAIDAVLLPVFQPLASSLLLINEASIVNISDLIPIPPGGFQNDLAVSLLFRLANNGSIDLTLDRLDFDIVDDDGLSFFDDLLASISLGLNNVIRSNSAIELRFSFLIPRSRLNAADDFFEGNFLELFGSGSFQFHDIYGARERGFVLAAIPEPSTLFLLSFGLFIIAVFTQAKQEKKRV